MANSVVEMRCRIFRSLIWVYTVCSGLSVQIFLVSTVVLWLVSDMSHHLNFTYPYCDLTNILHSNKQYGYPAWPLHKPRLTRPCHSWPYVADIHCPYIQGPWKYHESKRVNIHTFPFPTQRTFEIYHPISAFLVVLLQSKHWPFGDKCEFSNNYVLYFFLKNPSIATLQTKFSERGCI